MIDLHQHSNFSDGTDSVFELIEKNKATGIKYMSITDHDNISAAKTLEKSCDKYGLYYVTGVELSTDFMGNSIHILGYGYSVDDRAIVELVERAKALRVMRIKQRIELLKEEFDITLEKQDLDEILGSDNPNKPMIANILIKRGYGDNLSEVIKKYLYHNVLSGKIKTQEVIKTLSSSNIISVYAHPLGGVGEKRVSKQEFEKRLQSFIECGLRGLECYYSLYDKAEQEYLISIAKKYNLLVFGGSDYHGKNKSVQIGELSTYGRKISVRDMNSINELDFKTI